MANGFVSTNTQDVDTNWLEIVSAEMRAWWEVISGAGRNPDPIVVVPPPLITPTYTLSNATGMSQNTMLLIGGAVLLFVLLKK